ncbi:MAG: hypothetical protein HOH38_06180, partial [Nitrospinaceae bacterium]|nr:hypothetical protein [Nitrospinaceae bacterium]
NEILRLEGRLAEKNISPEKAQKYLAEGKWSLAAEEYVKLNAFNASNIDLLIEQGMVFENLNDKEKALGSYYDALRIDENHIELNKNLGNYYESANNLVLTVLHWKRYLEIAPHGVESSFIRKRFQFYSQQLKMQKLKKQVSGLSKEQNQALHEIYRNMKVKLGV